MNIDTVITTALVSISILTALISFVLAKTEILEKKKKYLGFKPRDIKNYLAYISLSTTIVVISLQTKKEIANNTDIMNRNRKIDSTEKKHFDSTLTAINSTLNLQKLTIDSTDSIIVRQSIELKNQKLVLNANTEILLKQEKEIVQTHKILIEADNLTASELIFSWYIWDDTIPGKTFSDLYKSNSISKTCSVDNGGNFEISDTCMQTFPDIVNSVNIFFINNENKKESIEKHFINDLVKSDYPSDYSLPDANLYFKNFNPDISVGTKYLENKSHFQCFQSKQLEGLFFYKTLILSRNNKPIPFSELGRMEAIVVINSPFKTFKISLMSLHNSKDNETVLINLGKQILSRTCQLAFRKPFYQAIFLANLKNQRRTD